MQVDFYQLSRDTVERVVPLLAAKAVEAGERLLVVHADAAQHAVLSEALWSREGAFLAHDAAGGAHDARQPILLSDACAPANGATMAILADGEWRDEAGGLARAILLFGPEQRAAARALWTTLSAAGHRLRVFKQGDSGGWREGR